MKFLIIIIFSCFSFINVKAQVMPADSLAVKESESLASQLNLSQAQTDKILFFTKLHQLKVNGIKNIKDTVQHKSVQLQKELTRYRADIQSVLTTTEYTQYLEIIDQRRTQFRNRAAQQNLSIKEVSQTN